MGKRTWTKLEGLFLERQKAPSGVLCACGCGLFISGRAARAKAKGKTAGYIKGHTWKGKRMPELAREKMRLNHADVSGEKNPNFGKGLFGPSNPNYQNGKVKWFYRGNIQPNVNTRADLAFRRSIVERDKVCVLCGSDRNRVVHHIETWVDREDLRREATNCVVLCKRCHGRADHLLHREAIKPMLLAYISTLSLEALS